MRKSLNGTEKSGGSWQIRTADQLVKSQRAIRALSLYSQHVTSPIYTIASCIFGDLARLQISKLQIVLLLFVSPWMGKMKRFLWIALLTACSGGGTPPNNVDPNFTWQGGLYNVYMPSAGVPVKARLILHQGHCRFECTFLDEQHGQANMREVAEQFANAGYAVYGFEMPPLPHTSGPIEKFYQPVLDLIAGWDDSLPIFMAGFSGGGWTTTIVTALSPRIRKGYSVQGDALHYPTPDRCAEIAKLRNLKAVLHC